MVDVSRVGVRLVQHLGQFRDEEWDDAVLNRTRICLLDNLASFSGGLSLPHFKQSARAITRSFCVNADGGSSAFMTAYLYGQAVIAMDYDDTFYGHPGGPIIGTILAIARDRHLSLDQVLRGIAAGYEAHGILCAAAEPTSAHAAKVRSVGNLDTVAAALGAAVALGYDDEQMEQVIGVAVAHSVVPFTAKWYERPVPGMKNNVGWIAAGAVLAIHLLEEGQLGVTEPLEGDKGLWRMIGSDRWMPDDSLFEREPAVLSTGFKRYPGCWWTQEYLKSFAALLTKLSPSDEVAEIVVASTPDMEKFCDERLLGTADVAFSLPAMFARLMEGVEPGPQWVLADKAAPNFRFEYQSSEVREIRVKTRTGQQIAQAVQLASISGGARNHGLDDDGVTAKFDRLAAENVKAAVGDLAPIRHPASYVPRALYDAMGALLKQEIAR